jgi:MtN3 and saliva related transmembrane protein
MEENFVTTIGLVAGALTTIAYVPQLLKTWRSKSAQDLSWSMLITLCVGIVLWLVYGIYAQDVPVIAANVVTLLLSSIILILKIKYEFKASPESQSSGIVTPSAVSPTQAE